MKKQTLKKILSMALAGIVTVAVMPAFTGTAQAAPASKITRITRKSPVKKNVTMYVGQNKTFKVTQKPKKLKKTAARLVWPSSSKTVARVTSKGKVTALKAGKVL